MSIVVSDYDHEPIRILTLTCRWFLTIGILTKVSRHIMNRVGVQVVSVSHRKCFFYALGISHISYSFSNSYPFLILGPRFLILSLFHVVSQEYFQYTLYF
uniref:Uncharacterized protein n=1 Tax=Solanum lycopersicum TaxID=4081 RepID=A0A3Q7J6Z1_SOLLC